MRDSSRTNQLDPHLRQTLAIIAGGVFMSVLDMTVVNVALGSLAAHLGATVGSVQWVVTTYLLALAATIPLTGWATRRFSASRVYTAGLILFTTGSALCAAAWSLPSLCAFRAVQGVGAGVLFPVAQTILSREAGPSRMAKAMSIFGSVAVIAPILGPILGGFVVDHLSWRWIFLVNIPIGLASLALAVARLPEPTTEPVGRPDLTGLLMLGGGLPLLIYGCTELAAGASFASFRGGGLFLLGLALIAQFVFHALRVTRPLLDLKLFRNRTYWLASAALFVFSAAVFGPYLVMPLFFRQVQHASPMLAGTLFASQGIGAAAAIHAGGRLAGRLPAGLLATIGAAAATLFTIPLATFTASTSHGVAVAVLIGRGFGIGLVMIPLIAAALSELTPPQLSDGSAQNNVIQRIGSSIGTAAIAVLLSSELAGNGDHSSASVAHAYNVTLWAAVGLAAAVLPFTLALLRRQLALARKPVAGGADTGTIPVPTGELASAEGRTQAG